MDKSNVAEGRSKIFVDLSTGDLENSGSLIDTLITLSEFSTLSTISTATIIYKKEENYYFIIIELKLAGTGNR